jgi:hypothetical protein
MLYRVLSPRCFFVLREIHVAMFFLGTCVFRGICMQPVSYEFVMQLGVYCHTEDAPSWVNNLFILFFPTRHVCKVGGGWRDIYYSLRSFRIIHSLLYASCSCSLNQICNFVNAIWMVPSESVMRGVTEMSVVSVKFPPFVSVFDSFRSA